MHRAILFCCALATATALRPTGAQGQTTLGSAFTYQGRLTRSGRPVTDTCDFKFSLWNDPDLADPVANQVGSAQTFTGLDAIEVSAGLLTVPLDFGSNAFDGAPRWLEIQVRCPVRFRDFIGLSPRQPITPAPYALHALGGGSNGDGSSLDAPDGDPIDALSVDNAGNVGIGTTTPAAALHLNKPLKPTFIRLETTRFDPAVPALTETRSPADVLALGGGVPWTNPGNTLTVDGSLSTVTLTGSNGGVDHDLSETLQWSGFGFNIPDNAPITGIEIVYTGNATCSCPDCTGLFALCSVTADFQLFSTRVTSEVRTSPLGGTVIPRSVGSEFDDWGLGWTPALVNSSDFAVRMSTLMTLRDTCSPFGRTVPCDCDCFAQAEPAFDAVSVTVYYRDVSADLRAVDWSMGIDEGETTFRIATSLDSSAPAISVRTDGRVGFGVPNPLNRIELPNIAGTFGRGRANAWITYSSRRHKQNIEPIDHAMEKVLGLTGVCFDWKPEQGGGHDIGFIAEDVAAVVPELVVWEADGKNVAGIKYARITALSVEAIKEQQQQIHMLREKNARLTARLERLEAMTEKHFGTQKEEK